jgi:hypothetical protein
VTYWNDKKEVVTVTKKEITEADIKQLKYDLLNFKKVNSTLTSDELADAFCAKWAGYNSVFGKERVREMVGTRWK